jgi:peptide/nickel transport system substrate-binding protein
MLDKDTALMALEKGEVDFMFDIPKTGIKKVNDNSNLEYYVTNAASTCFVVLNNENEILSNKKVRQALAHAVDKESLILGAVEGYGTPAETPISTSAFGWPEDFQNREYDIEKAKKLLSEAGYPDGFKIEFTATETLNFKKPGEILQDQFKKIGVELEIKEVEFGIYLDDVISGNNYQMAVTEQSTAYPDADHIYSLYHSTMRNVGRNFVNVNLPELDKLLDKGRVSNDPVERKAIYKEVCELWKEECITIPTYSLQTDVAANKDLKGILAHSPSVYKIYYYSWDN